MFVHSRSPLGSPNAHVHFSTGAKARRYLLALDGVDARQKLLSLLTFVTGPVRATTAAAGLLVLLHLVLEPPVLGAVVVLPLLLLLPLVLLLSPVLPLPLRQQLLSPVLLLLLRLL